VDIVTAGVHDAGDLRCEGQTRGFCEWEGIDIAPNSYYRAMAPPAGDASHYSGFCNPPNIRSSEVDQRLLQPRGGGFFLPGELRMAVELPPEGAEPVELILSELSGYGVRQGHDRK
jgi:hypothetical protein